MIKMLRYFCYKDWIMFVGIVLLIIGQVYLDLLIPEYMSKITECLQYESSAITELIQFGGLMLLFAFLSLIVSVLSVVLNARIGSNYSAALRKGMFYKVQDLSLKEEHHFTIASLITRTTNDITHIQMVILVGTQTIIHAPVLAAGALMKIFKKNWQWSAATGIAIVFVVFVMLTCIGLTMNKYKQIQELTDKLNNVTRESLTGVLTIRAYNAEKYQENKFNLINDKLVKNNIYTNTVMSLILPVANLVMNSLPLAIYWIGMLLINNAMPTEKVVLFSDMIAYTSYALQLASAFFMLVSILIFLPQSLVSLRRISEVLESPISIQEGHYDGKGITDCESEIEFKNVYFKYSSGNDYVLSDISLKVKKGETIAIIGSTGCGKTTLVGLIPRFYDISEGNILIDGVDIKKYTEKALRDKIGYISQTAFLLSGTVASNVSFGADGSSFDENKVKNAIKIANAEDFVYALDNTINGNITRNGNNLSGGQKQRLAIARAIYKNPEILIFDDAFSALDFRTEMLVRKAIKENCREAIKIIVSQRINTILDADRIIVLDNGKIVGSGTHSDLIQKCEVYKQIALTQLTKEDCNE